MKKILYLISITFLLLQSCSSEDNSSDNSPSQGVLVKNVLYSDGSYENYSYNGNKLLKVAWENGSSRVFTYTGNLITRTEIRDANNTFNGEFDTMSYYNGQLIQVKNYYNNILICKDDITYNSDGTRTITEMAYNYITGIYEGTSFIKQYFDSVGNIIKIEYINSTNVITTRYTYLYDTMNNPVKNITGITEYIYGLGTDGGLVNNLIKSTRTFISGGFTVVTNYSYQYNEQGYPISGYDGSNTFQIYYY